MGAGHQRVAGRLPGKRPAAGPAALRLRFLQNLCRAGDKGQGELLLRNGRVCVRWTVEGTLWGRGPPSQTLLCPRGQRACSQGTCACGPSRSSLSPP